MGTHYEVMHAHELSNADRFELIDGYFDDWWTGAMCLREIAGETFVHPDALHELFRSYWYARQEGIALRRP